MKDVRKKLEEIDALIKAAKWGEAQRELKEVKTGKGFPREMALTFASLCRRASVPELGLNVLRKYVHPTSRTAEAATEQEKNEYAASLVRIGACQEARNLLSHVTEKSSTDVIHTLASIYVKQWNYPAAIPLFLEYIDRPELTSYSRQIGALNLGLCLTFEEKLSQAEGVVRPVVDSQEAKAHPLINANALRLLGLIDFQRGNYREAITFFQKALDTFPESNGIDRFLVQKWLGIINYILEKGSPQCQKKIEFLRQRALEFEHWESIRDLEYHTALCDQNEEKLVHIYFGTPFERFRSRILRKHPNLKLPPTFTWRPSQLVAKPKQVFNIIESNLKPGQSMHRLLSVLSSDFYRPLSVIDVFDRVFSGAFYSPGASEQRVHQLLTRTRTWLDDEKIRLQIVSDKNRIQLLEKDCAILVHLEGAGEEQDYFRLNTIRNSLGETFSAVEAGKLFDFSRRTLLNLLTKAVEDGVLIRKGEGKNTRYSFADSQKSQAA